MHKLLEDSSFVWRSMYAAHLRSWLRLFPARQLFVIDPSVLLDTSAVAGTTSAAPATGVGSAHDGAHAFIAWLGLPLEALRDEVLATSFHGARQLGTALGMASGVHENARRYVLDTALGTKSSGTISPPELSRSVRDFLRPHQCDLAGLLLRRGLAYSPNGLLLVPWLAEEFQSSAEWARAEGPGGGICAGVVSVDEWFVAK